MPKQYLDANGNPIPSPVKNYLDPNTGQPAPPAQPRAAAPVGGDMRPLTQQENFSNTFPVGVRGEGVGENVKNFANNVGVSMWNTLAHPVTTAQSLFASVMPQQLVDSSRKAYEDDARAKGLTPAPRGPLDSTPNPIQGLYEGLNTRPADTIASGIGQGIVMGGASDIIPAGYGRGAALAKRLVTGDVNAPIPGTDTTPMQRYTAMRGMGISPDAAEATNSGFLKGLKRVNQNSLTAQPTYEKAQAANLNALQNYTTGTLNQMSELSPEEGGAAVQEGLLRHHAALKQAATKGFQALDKEAGDQPIPGAADIQQQAKNIVAQNAEYYRLHPEFEPTRAMTIVKDLARGGPATKPAPKVISGFGSASAAPPEPVAPRVPTYTELHRLRSDLLDFNNANPDLVKNQANAWISQLAGAADNAITSSEGGLTPGQVETFRNANEAWKTMKGTYDNPQSPLYSAVRTQAPSTLVSGISKTPEMAGTLRSNLTNIEVGPIQRGVAEGALKTTAQGPYNFKTFQSQFNKLPQGYKQNLFNPAQLESLNDIGQAGSVLNTDLNPSGSAKQAQGIGEGVSLAGSVINPPVLAGNILYHGAQYLTGKAMNNPAVVNALMRPTLPTPRLGLYGAGLGAVSRPSNPR